MNKLRHTFILVMMVITLLGCGSSLETAGDYVESGKALVQEGKLDKARLEFKNAIQIDPRTAEAFYQLALLDEKSQKWKAMYSNLSTAEQLDPTHLAASTKLGQIYLLSGNFDEANQKVEKVLAASPDDVGGLILRASIDLKQRNFGAAIKNVEHALSIDNKNTEAMSVKALAYSQQGDTKVAMAILDEALSVKPDLLSLLMIKLSILEGEKDYASVEQIYRDLRESRPEERWVVASLAKLLNGLDRYDDAKQELEKFIISNPGDRETKLMLVSLVQTRNASDAIELLNSYIQADSSDYDMYFAKVKLQLDNGKMEEAIAGLENIVTSDPEGNNGRKATMILANYDYRRGKLDSARGKIDRVLSSAPEDEAALILQSRVNLTNNEIDKAITDLRLVLRNNLESDEAMVLLGQAYTQTGNKDLAEDNFRQALEVNSGNRVAALYVAESMLRTENVERAESVVMAALQANPLDPELLRFLAGVKILEEDWDGAAQISEKLSEAGAKPSVISFLDGRVLQGKKKHSLALDKYKQALSQDKTMLLALSAIAYNYMQLGERDNLEAFLKGLIEQDPKYLMAYGFLADLYINEKAWENVISLTKEGLAVDNKWQTGYLMLSAAERRVDGENASIVTLEKGVAALPMDDVLALRLASAYETQKEFQKARTMYESILKRSPDVEVAINNLASLLTDQFRTDENLREALKITERFQSSSEPYFLDTYGWVNLQLGNIDKAEIILERVIQKAPDVAIFNYHLAVLYFEKSEQSLAEKYLKVALPIAEEQNDAALIDKIDKLLKTL